MAVRAFVAADSAYCDLVGYSEHDLTVLPWPKIMADDTQVAPVHQAMTTDQPPDDAVRWTFRRQDGRSVTVALKYRPVALVDGDGASDEVLFAVIVATPGSRSLSAREAFGV